MGITMGFLGIYLQVCWWNNAFFRLLIENSVSSCCSVSSAPCRKSALLIDGICWWIVPLVSLWSDINWYQRSVSKVLRWWIHLGERVLLGLVPSGQESGRLLVRCWAHGAAERLGLRWGRNVKAKLQYLGLSPKIGKWHVLTCRISWEFAQQMGV